MLTDDRIDQIFAEMQEYTLELEREPSMLGPSYFQEVIAQCRDYLNRVGRVLLELNRQILEVDTDLRRQEASYSLEYDELLANDERVTTLANIEDRKSTANFLLRVEKQEINELKDRKQRLAAVLKVVTYRNRELHSTMTAIKDQRRWVQTEVATGAFYGDERVPKQKGSYRDPLEGMGVEDPSVEEIENMFADEEEESSSEPDLTDVPSEEDSGSSPPSDTQESPEKEAGVPSEVVASEENDPVSEEELLGFVEGGGTAAPPPVVEGSAKPSDLDADVLELLENL